MTQLENAMGIFKILPRTNCKGCKLSTCFAFAAAAFKGEKKLQDCPYLDDETLNEYEISNSGSRTLANEEENYLKDLGDQVQNIDLAASVDRLGATFFNGKLAVPVLGKPFYVDQQGNVTSDCHVHGWISVPILNYVISCKGKPASGNWAHIREFKDGAAWAGLFAQRCEKPLKKVADNYPDLFEHMIQIFSAKRTEKVFDSDVSVILYPMPRIPMLICYWKPDESMDSSINIFFDDSAQENLNIDSLYRISAGIALMFEKIAFTHGC